MLSILSSSQPLRAADSAQKGDGIDGNLVLLIEPQPSLLQSMTMCTSDVSDADGPSILPEEEAKAKLIVDMRAIMSECRELPHEDGVVFGKKVLHITALLCLLQQQIARVQQFAVFGVQIALNCVSSMSATARRAASHPPPLLLNLRTLPS